MGEPVCSFPGRVVVGQVVTVQPAVRAVAAGDKGGVRGTRTRDLHGVCTWSPHGSGPLLWRRPLRSSDAAAVGQLMLRESACVSSTHQRKGIPGGQ